MAASAGGAPSSRSSEAARPRGQPPRTALRLSTLTLPPASAAARRSASSRTPAANARNRLRDLVGPLGIPRLNQLCESRNGTVEGVADVWIAPDLIKNRTRRDLAPEHSKKSNRAVRSNRRKFDSGCFPTAVYRGRGNLRTALIGGYGFPSALAGNRENGSGKPCIRLRGRFQSGKKRKSAFKFVSGPLARINRPSCTTGVCAGVTPSSSASCFCVQSGCSSSSSRRRAARVPLATVCGESRPSESFAPAPPEGRTNCRLRVPGCRASVPPPFPEGCQRGG